MTTEQASSSRESRKNKKIAKKCIRNKNIIHCIIQKEKQKKLSSFFGVWNITMWKKIQKSQVVLMINCQRGKSFYFRKKVFTDFTLCVHSLLYWFCMFYFCSFRVNTFFPATTTNFFLLFLRQYLFIVNRDEKLKQNGIKELYIGSECYAERKELY